MAGAAMLFASLLAVAAATSNGDLASWYATRTLVDSVTQMQPEVVAKLLSQVEHKWEEMALADLRGKTEAGASIASMKESCGKITMAIVKGSDGDKDRVATYLQDVCQRASGENAPMCKSFASVLNTHLSHDVYSNREELDAGEFCADLYEGAVKDQVKKESAALEAADKAAAEKAKADAEAKAAAEKEVAKAKARAATEATRAEANELAAQAAKELDQAKNIISKAKEGVDEQVKKVDAINKQVKNATSMADQGRKEFELATEKEAEAAEKEAVEAQQKVAALRLKKAEEAKAEAEAKADAEAKAEAEKKAEKAAAAAKADAEKKAEAEKKVESDKKAAAKKEPEKEAVAEKKTALLGKSVAAQDPCAGCTDPAVVEYQKCSSTMKYNPCAKQYTGVAFDNHCCIVKEQHMRCLQCKAQGTRKHYNSKWTDQKNTGVTVVEAQVAKQLSKTNVAVKK